MEPEQTETTRKRRGPSRTRRLLDRASETTAAFVGPILEKPIAFGLAVAATALIVLFFVGLSLLSPHSPGTQTTLSNATDLISRNRVSSDGTNVSEPDEHIQR